MLTVKKVKERQKLTKILTEELTQLYLRTDVILLACYLKKFKKV